MPTSGIIAIAGVKPGSEEQLRATLNRIGNDVRGRRLAVGAPEPHIDFPRSRTIHFARLALLDDTDRAPGRKRLLLATDYDGAWRDHVAELHALTTVPDRIWGCCEGYAGRDRFPEFIRARTVEPQAYYIAFPGDTLEGIRRALQFWKRVGAQLNLAPQAPLPALARRGLDAAIRIPAAGLEALDILRRNGPLNALLAARQINATLDRIWWVWFFNRLTLNSPASARTRYSEAPPDTAADCAPATAEDEVVSGSEQDGTPGEDLVSQNQLTLLTVVRPERVERLRAVLDLINLYARRLSPKGSLVGISTIHTVRWALIDGGKRLLMVSNYDGTWESYIDEFAELILSGLDALWTGSHGFPESGSQDVAALKHFLRCHQAPANVFYSAYPDATVLNISDALDMEQGLSPKIDVATRQAQQTKEMRRS